MASVVLQKFSGLVPRSSPRLLANGAATVASMAKMWSGEIRPFHTRAVITLPLVSQYPNDVFPTDGIVRTIYRLGAFWLAWKTVVDVVSGFTALAEAGQIYYTGDGAPKQTNITAIASGPAAPITTYPIGVVGPTGPIVAAVVVGGGPVGGILTRSYVYTYYTGFNEESVPSPPSNFVDVDEARGDTVNISNFIPPPTATVDRIRIYRTEGSDFLFVMEVFTGPLFATPYPYTINDNVLDANLGEPLVSQHYYPPPADIVGLIGLACGSLAAFHGNRVVFSEPYQPGAWPPEYEKVFDYDIVALGTFGQTCVVATTGYTYLVSGTNPRSFSVARIPDPYPCLNRTSMVSTDNGCVYASNDGLIFVGVATYYTGGSGVHVLTRGLMTREEWQAYNPATIVAAVNEGRYYGFYLHTRPDATTYPGAGFIFDFNDRSEALVTGAIADGGSERTDILVDTNFWASAVFANPSVPLHMVTQPIPSPGPTYTNTLSQWDAGTDFESWTWRSKQFSYPYAITFSTAKLMFNTAFPIDPSFTFRLLDGVSGNVLYQRPVTSRTPFRLPSLGPRTDWLVEVQGKSAVQLIELSSSYQDLEDRKTA